MSNHLESLMFTIKVIDEATGGVSKIINQIDQVKQHYQAGMVGIATGVGGVLGSGYILNKMLSPAVEMDRALGGLKSLDVATDSMRHLERSALATSIRYGMSAANIVSSSYDIQSAIAGLQGKELAAFTQASAILAKGTKADTATITDYMGTMYGIFKQNADSMGKAQWVEMLTGQTATAVQMFKTDGAKMSAAFGNLGAEATSFGVSMNEQMAILGTLQATMGGGESATKYRAFLAGVGQAQDKLGLKFTDSNNRLLPMVDILEALRGKFGETLDVAEGDQLKKAFGSGEATALIKLLMADTNGLAASIDQLGQVTGMTAAEKMAKDLADPLEQSSAAATAIATVFGRVLLPALAPVFAGIQDGSTTLLHWMDIAPNLTAILGKLTLGVLAMIAAFSTFAIIGGVSKIVMAGYFTVLAVGSTIMKAWALTKWAGVAAMSTFRAVALATAIQVGLLNGSLGLSTAAAWRLSARLAEIGDTRGERQRKSASASQSIDERMDARSPPGDLEV